MKAQKKQKIPLITRAEFTELRRYAAEIRAFALRIYEALPRLEIAIAVAENILTNDEGIRRELCRALRLKGALHLRPKRRGRK